MRISDRYIGRQVLSGTLFALVLLTLLLVIGNLFKEIRPILVEFGAPVSVLGDFILNVLPISLIFTIPWAFLSAVLLVFGRLSSENELTAFRTAGLSLTRLGAPVILLGALLSGLCLWLNLNVAPHAKKKVDNVEIIAARAIIRDPASLLRAASRQNYFTNVQFYSESDDGDTFNNFHIFVTDPKDPGLLDAYLHGARARTMIDHEAKQVSVRLDDAYAGTGPNDSGLVEDLKWIAFDYSDEPRRKQKPSAMTNAEIDEFLANWPTPPADATPEDLARIRGYMGNYRAEKFRRYASSMACLAFALIGVPLGIKTRRRDTSSGLLLSLAIGAAYFVGGSMLGGGNGEMWMVWLPNIVCLSLGILLFRRARFR